MVRDFHVNFSTCQDVVLEPSSISISSKTKKQNKKNGGACVLFQSPVKGEKQLGTSENPPTDLLLYIFAAYMKKK